MSLRTSMVDSFALCNCPALLTSGILRLEELQDIALHNNMFNSSVHQEHRVFIELLDSYPGLLNCLTNGEEEDIIHVGELVMTGALLCPAGLDWLNADGETAVCGDQWPIFLYTSYIYDLEDLWKVSLHRVSNMFFMSLSSVDRELKATCSGNAYLHGMKSVTKGSLAYIATSSSVFSHTNMVTDSTNFYHSILDLLEDPDETEEVADLMMWWMHWIFPSSSSSHRCISKNSALSKIREKHATLQERATADAT
ncbi:hypothetical protein BDR07DRAFT_1455344 [Suillus spraguei]|nr:hypothetical protein BDR07DRAFT_1455344 [Suillus spraguei]